MAAREDLSEPPFYFRFLGRRPPVTLFQRGSASEQNPPLVMNTRYLQLQIATLAMKRITDNIPESSTFGTVNNELTASDTLLLRKRKRRPC